MGTALSLFPLRSSSSSCSSWASLLQEEKVKGQRSPRQQSPEVVGGGLPGGEGLQLVVGQVQHLEAAMLAQQRDTLVRQAVIGQVDLLEAAAAVL